MGVLLETERQTYGEAWSLQDYAAHAPGEHYAPKFLEMAGLSGDRPGLQARTLTVLDAGAGSGKGALALEALGFGVTLVDITADGLVPEARRFRYISAPLWSNLRANVGRFDFVYCCDVLEHLDESMTMLAIARMLDASTRGLFLSIALVPDQFGLLVGRPLHLTVRPFTWWRDRIGELGTIVECRDLIDAGLYLVTP